MVAEEALREKRARAGRIGMERRWGTVKLSDLTPAQARLVRALIDNMKATTPDAPRAEQGSPPEAA